MSDETPPDVTFHCPFCHGRVFTDMVACAVFHTLPTCKRYEALEISDFLKACRLEMGGKEVN